MPARCSTQALQNEELRGFGWQIEKDGGFSHGGSFKTFMKILPRHNLIIISLEQIDGTWPNQGGDKIFPALVAAALAKFGNGNH